MQLNSVVGGYKVIELVGEGGMGTVFRGLDILLEREVALKLLRPELPHNPHLVKRFRTEAVALARLNHPHIVTLHQLFRDGDNYFMVLEFVLGETLDRLIKRCGPIPWQTALPLICQALEGLEHAHILKVIHRDIKPANLILTQAGVVKLMDFGVARMLENSEATQSGYILGTLKYMSPEQIQGQDIDYRVDIYAIGMVLYELLTGHAPFDKQTDYELIRAHVEEYPKPPMMYLPHIPPRLDAAVLRALEKSPAERFQSASEFRGELEAILKAASVDLAEGEEIFPDLGQPSSDTSGIFTPPTLGDHLRAAFGRWRDEPESAESAAQTVLLPPRGLNGESRQDAPATAAQTESFWNRNSRTAYMTLLLPVFLLAFFLLPIDPRSPPVESAATQLAPEIQAAIESPPSAGMPTASVDDGPQETEKSQRPENPGPVDNSGQAMPPRTEALQTSGVESEPVARQPGLGVQALVESPLETETPRASTDPVPETLDMASEKSPSAENSGPVENIVDRALPSTTQAMNSEDAALPDQKPSKKMSTKSASHRNSSRRKKLDGGWTIISD
ncbi:MAG: protein kinase [Methylococcaceae bacterium]|nr:protein kinase [Methylococcaceae bacterium]